MTAYVRPGQLDDFLACLTEGVRDFPRRHSAMLSDRILVGTDGDRVVYESVGPSADDLAAHAGPD